MEDKRDLSVGGYLFYTEKDAKIAAAERKKIEYLETRIDYSKPEDVLRIYENLLRERIFKTPIGLQYLKQMRDFLREQEGIDQEAVQDVPLYIVFGGELREHGRFARNRIRPSDEEEKKEEKAKARFTISVILNILLIVAVISMFTITLESDNPNILNYERAITDRYASWEQELTERERIIREKERELKLDGQGAQE